MRGFRAPLDHLAGTNTELADRFRDVSHLPENLTTSPTMLQSDSGAVRGGSSMLGVYGERIAASEGPVIVNRCKYRSDTLIVLSWDYLPVVCVPVDEEFYDDSTNMCKELLETYTSSGADLREYDQTLRQVMKALWDRVVSKVVDKVKELGIAEGARIWWCPTSVLSALPFHAAGSFEHTDGSVRYRLDKYILLCTPTLAVLISTRSGGDGGEATVLVTGDTSLRNPSCDIVIKELRKATWVYFVCHGLLHSTPFNSSFKLSDGRLALLDVVQGNLPNAEFAYLSARHTAEQPRDDLHDEILHLAAAMQFSGFQSVVGSMW
ncbi:uncharacterized protein FOMMEDRAFT_149923 [Fomitiporia mediterranea MF3/22]|uniref:uncharacterized protein n=1 Tax=Fomitiporia mediterranea (strain MF3/22) TaxID=694068 RepID=UPI00044083CE|nr:uncharacterized protein FOMMEDRAFT_149923 [Fomitiporia mediterranea MF3/22]EJD07398.1 hypothetical protein FOMMEDRAFT_149923 [Fomitiporia mediterranea MF3/22]